MPGITNSGALAIGSFVIGFLAAMTATWSFARYEPAWGASNVAVALVSLLTFIAVRARNPEA